MNKHFLALTLSMALAACGPTAPPAASTTSTETSTAATTEASTEAAEAPVQAPPAAAPAKRSTAKSAPAHATVSNAATRTASSEPPMPEAPVTPAVHTAPVCADCGVIAAVREESVKGDPSAVGTLGGAAAGGLAGAQFGKKSGKILATIGGAVLGGLAGREVESRVKSKTVYHVTVDMEDGSQRSVTVDALNGLGVGTKVRVVGNALQFNG